MVKFYCLLNTNSLTHYGVLNWSIFPQPLLVRLELNSIPLGTDAALLIYRPELPCNILECETLASFRRHLKTHYFQSAYPAH